MKKVPLASVLSEQPRNGWSPPAEYQTGTGVPVLTLSSVTGFEYDGTRTKLTSAPSKDGAHYWLQAGELLITRSNTEDLVGHVAVYDGFPANAICCDLIMKMKVDPAKALTRYIYYFLRSPESRKYLSSRAQGASPTMKKIGKQVVQNIPVPVPPLAEQQRIVGLLDEAFEGLATAKANAEKNLQNARALFESHLQSVFTQRGPGWVETTLEEVADADCSLSYGIVQPGEEFDKGMPVVRPTDLTTKVIRLDGLKRIDPKLAGGYKRTALQGGELLLCVRGSTGTVSIASPELVGANVTRGIVPIRFNRSLLLPEFGFYLISGGPVQSQIREKTYGTALMQINIRDLRLISLSIPPLKEQKTIAAKLDSLHEETQRLARLYERKLAALEALKKALLHQAFAGEL
jgi:type I restriction enzyme S subunit